MSGYLESVQKSKNYNNYKLTADKVIQVLSEVRNEKTKSRRRWIWELMQNAKDVPNVYKSVTIQITLRENEFVFSHNGNPFAVENITGLIQQVSSGKPSNSSNRRITGKFGTGFISTHLLSDTVIVNGIVEKEGLDPKSFQLELNRCAETSEDLIKPIADELDKIEKIDDEKLFPTKINYHSQRLETHYDTVFTYPLENPDSQKAASVGVEDLAVTLPQTLFFVDELKKVIINNEVKGEQISYELFENNNEGDFYFPLIKETINGNTQDLCFICYKGDLLDLAVLVDNHNDRTIKSIEKSPRLYRDFPLVGTEQFYFPFILNGLNFFPTEKRDSILLTDTTSRGVVVNREILVQAMEKAKIFVEWLNNNGAKNLSLLGQSKVPNILSELEVVDWFKKAIQIPYREFLMTQDIVETKKAKKSLKTAKIPKFSGTKIQNEKFWDILEKYFSNENICRKEHLISWHDNLGSESEMETWGQKVFYTIEDLMKEIQSNITLEEISLFDSSTTNIDWLNIVYQFLIDNKLTEYFREYKIIPTIKGTLKSFSDDLYIEKDNLIPDEFISIYKALKDEDWNDILVHRSIIAIDNTHASKTIKDISDEINKLLNFEEKNQQGKAQRTFADRVNAETFLLDILRIFPSSAKESFQTKLFDLGKEFFNYLKEPLVISGISDFNFNPAKRQLIKLLNSKIEKAGCLEAISPTNSNRWVLEYVIMLQESSEYKTFLEFGEIFPNRKNKFRDFKEIFSFGTDDNPLSDTLIEILHELNDKEDWNEILIHDDFRKVNLRPKKIDELANKIQVELERLRIENAFSSKSTTILKLIRWCSMHSIEAQKYFGAFMAQKDKIFVNISLDDDFVGGNVMKLLSNKEKLGELVAIAESDVDVSHLAQIVKSGVSLDELSEIANIAKTVGIEKIKDLAIELKEEKDDFDFKKQIGNEVEQVFIDAFNSLQLPYTPKYQGSGSQDVVITNPANQKKFFIELKSLSPSNPDKSLRLAISQAKKASVTINEGNYVVSVLLRPQNWQSVSVDFIKENLKTISSIGSIVSEAVAKNNAFEELINSTSDVDLIFEDTERKVRISESVWQKNNQPFDRLIELVKLYLG